MTLHVDLVENRWSAGYQERVARVEVSDERYQDVARFRSDYFFATAPHDDDDCPFAQNPVVKFVGKPVGSARPPAHRPDNRE